jgi:hypothetical protein
LSSRYQCVTILSDANFKKKKVDGDFCPMAY